MAVSLWCNLGMWHDMPWNGYFTIFKSYAPAKFISLAPPHALCVWNLFSFIHFRVRRYYVHHAQWCFELRLKICTYTFVMCSVTTCLTIQSGFSSLLFFFSFPSLFKCHKSPHTFKCHYHFDSISIPFSFIRTKTHKKLETIFRFKAFVYFSFAYISFLFQSFVHRILLLEYLCRNFSGMRLLFDWQKMSLRTQTKRLQYIFA